jgi:Glycosyltransferase family 87
VRYRPFVVSGCAFLFIIQITYFAMAFPGAIRGRADFSTLYTAGFMIRSGHASELYDYDTNTEVQEQIIGPSHGPVPFNHLAYETLFFAPFSLLPYRAAYGVFLALNLALLLCSYRVIRVHATHLDGIWHPLSGAVFACFLSVGIALFQGQDSIILLALLTWAYLAADKGHDSRAGFFLGLTLFKFQYCIPIALLYLAWKRWRIFLSFAATATVAVAVSFLITGLSRLSIYTSYLFSVSTRLGPGEQLKYAISPLAMPNIFGLLFAFVGNHTVVTIIVSCAIIAWAACRPPSFPLAVAVAMLVSYHGLIHDAAILIIPILLFAEAALRDERRRLNRIWVPMAALIYPTIAVSVTLPYCLLALPVLGFLPGPDEKAFALTSTDAQNAGIPASS